MDICLCANRGSQPECVELYVLSGMILEISYNTTNLTGRKPFAIKSDSFLTVSKSQVAAAFRKDCEGFEKLLPGLLLLGFPEPMPNDIWRVVDIMDWVGVQQDLNLSLIAHLTDWMGVKPV
jgi:hypothetical protein